MLSKKMAGAINDQINAETYSAYLYLSMSAACNALGLKGAATWFFVQTQEEMTHSTRFYLYLNRHQAKVTLQAIEQPPSEFSGVLEMYEAALKHEQYITSRINKLVEIARQEKDPATEVFLEWFVNEQVEEEENATDIIGQLKMVGKDGSALFMLDKDLATRTFTMAPDLILPGSGAGAAAP